MHSVQESALFHMQFTPHFHSSPPPGCEGHVRWPEGPDSDHGPCVLHMWVRGSIFEGTGTFLVARGSVLEGVRTFLAVRGLGALGIFFVVRGSVPEGTGSL